ncbi:RluA family pseudouridine synthase [Candidatus Margulisiibacteriota bacterium]
MKKPGQVTIVYEDKNLLAINKPAFLPVHPGFNKRDFTLIDWLDKKYPPKGTIQLLNRIDKETSGIVLAAKNEAFLQKFNKELSKDIYKEYIVMIRKPKKKITEINFPLQGIYRDKNKAMPALTKVVSFQPLKDRVSLLHVSLVTGRTHQIRRHFKMVGSPVVGDFQYGDIHLNKRFRKDYKLRRQFLHAYKVKIKGFPEITAQLPIDLEKTLQLLKL